MEFLAIIFIPVMLLMLVPQKKLGVALSLRILTSMQSLLLKTSLRLCPSLYLFLSLQSALLL